LALAHKIANGSVKEVSAQMLDDKVFPFLFIFPYSRSLFPSTVSDEYF